jgi:hypothetical protein
MAMHVFGDTLAVDSFLDFADRRKLSYSRISRENAPRPLLSLFVSQYDLGDKLWEDVLVDVNPRICSVRLSIAEGRIRHRVLD